MRCVETKLAAYNASPFDLDDPTEKEGTGTINSLQISLRASSPIWASEASLTRTSAPRSRVLARLASLAQTGELARRLSTNHFLSLFLCRRGSQTGESHYQIQNRRSKVRIPGYEGEETRKKKVL